MRRRLFQIAAAASFALCLAVHICWLRSHFCSEKVVWSTRYGWRSVQTAQGHLEVGLLLVDSSDQAPTLFHGPRYEREDVRQPTRYPALLCSSRGDMDIDWQLAGFAWIAKLNSLQGVHHSTAVIPCWFLALATLALPLAATTQRLRSRSFNPQPEAREVRGRSRLRQAIETPNANGDAVS